MHFTKTGGMNDKWSVSKTRLNEINYPNKRYCSTSIVFGFEMSLCVFNAMMMIMIMAELSERIRPCNECRVLSNQIQNVENNNNNEELQWKNRHQRTFPYPLCESCYTEYLINDLYSVHWKLYYTTFTHPNYTWFLLWNSPPHVHIHFICEQTQIIVWRIA